MKSHPVHSPRVYTQYELMKDGFSISVKCCQEQATAFIGLEVLMNASRPQILQGLHTLFEEMINEHPTISDLLVKLSQESINYESNYDEISASNSLQTLNILHEYLYTWKSSGSIVISNGDHESKWLSTSDVEDPLSPAFDWKDYYSDEGDALMGRPPQVSGLPGIRSKVKNPVTGETGWMERVIINLNDQQKWTREQIADWLETLDIDIRFKAGEEGTHDKVG